MTVHHPTFSNAGLAASPEGAGAATESALEVAPFARLTIGEAAYDVGTVKNSPEEATREILAFRSGADAPWRQLKAGLDDGWRPVAAEVVRNTRDALQDYVRMHMIRRSGKFTAGDKVSLTLFGFDWEVRVSSDGRRAQVKLPETGWEEVDRSLLQDYSDLKELAIAALIKFSPTIHEVFEDDVDAWALRLAAGASVTPIM